MTKRKDAYLDTYVHHHPCPSWKTISEVLRRYNLNQQANEVENTYVQGMCVRVTFMVNILMKNLPRSSIKGWFIKR